MKKTAIPKNRLFFYVSSSLLLLIVSFFVINILSGKISLANLYNKWDGKTIAKNFASGKGTEEDPYKISNAFELAYLRKVVNEKIQDEENGGYFYDKHYKLVRDIDLGEHSWTPIGNNDENSFSGYLDGNGYTIYNLSLNNNSNLDNNYLGLFGRIENGEVKNITLSNVLIDLNNFANNKETYIGALAGAIKSNEINTFQNLVVKNVNITGDYQQTQSLYISDFSGKNEGILKFYNILIISEANVKTNSNIKNGVLTGYNENSEYNNVFIIGNNREVFAELSDKITNFSTNIYGKTNDTLYKWQYSNYKYNPFETDENISAILDIFNNNENIGNYSWKIENNSVNLSKKSNQNEDPSQLQITFYGEGTIIKPYLIGSEEDLNKLREQVNNGNSYDGKYFQLTSDIELKNNYIPIGTTTNSFKGNFDGAGHSISNMKMQIASNNSTIASYGFFGSIGGGNSQFIKNIEFENPTITLNITYSRQNVNGYNIGTVAGAIYNNAHIENIIVNNLIITNTTGFSIDSQNFRLQIGGIAGVATNTSSSDANPGAEKYYSIKNSYVSSDINISNITLNNRTNALYQTIGGIIGSIVNQGSWPENCLYEGNINSQNAFVGPIFAYVRNNTTTSATDFNTYFEGNAIRSSTINSYYNNYNVRGRIFTSSISNGSVQNDNNYRYSTSNNEIGYVQGVNKGLYLNSYTTKENLINIWNENNNVKVTLNNGIYHFNERLTSSISETDNYYYNVQLTDLYNTNNYTYTWYKDGVEDKDFTNNTYSYDSANLNNLLHNRTIDCIVYDGIYYSMSKYTISRLSLDLVIDVNKTNKTANAYFVGDAAPYLNLNDYTFEWYREDITGLDSSKIEDVTTNYISNLDEDYDYKLVATNNKYPDASFQESFIVQERTVIYVNGTSGNNNNNGLTENTAVKTIQNAYTKLSPNGTMKSNIIVLIGNYTTNDFLYGKTTTTANNYSKNATVTGYYRSKDYNADLYFTGPAPSNNTNGRYLYADTRLMYLNLNGSGNRQTYLYCQGHSLTMGKNITLSNYNTTRNTNGLINNAGSPDFHIMGGFNDKNDLTMPDENNYGTIKIQSGTYARVVIGSRNTKVNTTSSNFTGLKNKPFTMHLILDIESPTTNYSQYPYDVNLVVGGQTNGNIYADSVIDIKNGNFGRVIGGSIGYSSNSRKSTTIPLNTYMGTSTTNVYGGKINELYGGSLGRSTDRVTDNTYYYGISTINIFGGTIESNIYSAGAGGVTGYSSSSSDPFKNYGQDYDTIVNLNIFGGTMDGNIYGAGYGYSAYISSNEMSRDGGSLYGNSNIIISGGTINGNVYGAGRGTNAYGSNFNKLAQMHGTSKVVIKENANILGDVYGAGEGLTDSNYAESARLYGDSNVYLEKDLDVNVYGGGNAASVIGTSNVYINSGNFTKDIYGGGNVGDIEGTSTITLNGGICNNVYGAGKNNDVTNTLITLKGGTANTIYGGGRESNATNTKITLLGSNVDTIYGGSNQDGTVTNTLIITTSGIVKNIYGGNNAGGITNTTNLEINNINIEKVYGGGNNVNNNTSNITVNSGNIDNLYGGGNKGKVQNTFIDVVGGEIGNLFAGGNEATADITTTNIYGGIIGNMYGGGNKVGVTSSNINTFAGTITNLFGGGNESGLTDSNLNLVGGEIKNVYGGSNVSGNVLNSNINIKDYDTDNDNNDNNNNDNNNDNNNESDNDNENDNESDNIETETSSNIKLDVLYNQTTPESWQSTTYKTYADITVKLTNNTAEEISDWEISLNIPDSVIYTNYTSSNITKSGDIYNINSVNIYHGYNTLTANGGTYEFTFAVMSNIAPSNFVVTSNIIKPVIKQEVKIDTPSTEPTTDPITTPSTPTTIEPIVVPTTKINIDNIYGGNNEGGTTTKSNIIVTKGTIGNIFGGGNKAEIDFTNINISNATINNIYGGGNAASVNNNTYIDIDNATINGNVYGGGNEGLVEKNTEVFITDSNILGSAYAGGNGATAIVYGDTTINLDGKTVVGSENSKAPASGCVFGGGNAAATGEEESNKSTATVNIVGATIYGNVYGGANTSVVYGKTFTNIGTDAVKNSNLIEDNINIHGTIFGGGEANASGSEIYDYSFICVTTAIDIKINGRGYESNNHEFTISGSIFGSGNASSSSGTSDIYISNLGTKDSPSKNISIQRSDNVVIDKSVIELEGTTDRTNEYSTIKYSFNRIDSLTIKNNTTLLLKQNANLLKELNSSVDIDGKLEKATVSIDDETKKVTKNVDNRIYLIPNRNLNIATNETATSYGKISGMTFFGMYNSYSNSNSFSYGVYDSSFTYGSSADAGDVIVGGSYVLGLHSLDHDITKDGFYSNYLSEDYNEVTTAYINPTPPDSNYYMWNIGTPAINYSFSLTASKYSSLGTYELSMIDFPKGDTTFNVIGFNSEGLAKGVSLVDSNSVPKVTNTAEEANKVLGLTMKSETREWTNYGNTKFISKDNGVYSGTTSYKTDSQLVAPSLMFYLYHAKNITLNGELGTVVVTLQALTPKNEIEYDVQLITITIDINARNYDDGNSYDASITYDRKYEMPSATLVNITNQSQFTTYYSLIANSETFEEFYGKNNSNYHVLTTNYALPIGTQITMLDYGINGNNPEYYYYTITDEIYNNSLLMLQKENEVTYKLSDFIKMGSTSTSNRYNDQDANKKYYSETHKRTIEEFIFIFDFKNTNTTGSHLNNSILFELRNNEDRALVSVLGIRQDIMNYNTYDSSNVVLKENVSNSNEYLYYNVPNLIEYSTIVDYDQTENRQAIIDTNYESSNMGINVSIFDSSNNQLSSSMLSGTSIKIDNTNYYVDSDGVYRIKLAGKVSNLNKNIYLTVDNLLPAGSYTLKFMLFASSDGLHSSTSLAASTIEIPVVVVGNNNSIVVDTNDKTKVVDGKTGLNDDGLNINKYVIKYYSELSNPNVRLSLYKRSVSTKDTTSYEEIDINKIFKNSLLTPKDANYIAQTKYEKLITMNETGNTTLNLEFNNELISGTYKLVFSLYDKNQKIDEEIKYIIIKKDIQ